MTSLETIQEEDKVERQDGDGHGGDKGVAALRDGGAAEAAAAAGHFKKSTRDQA